MREKETTSTKTRNRTWFVFSRTRINPSPHVAITIYNRTGRSGSCLTVPANVIWILVGGIAVTLNHIIMGALLFVTIIGIPWARQHFILVEISLLPFGKKVVRV